MNNVYNDKKEKGALYTGVDCLEFDYTHSIHKDSEGNCYPNGFPENHPCDDTEVSTPSSPAQPSQPSQPFRPDTPPPGYSPKPRTGPDLTKRATGGLVSVSRYLKGR